MILELKVYSPNDALDSGYEYIGSVRSRDGQTAELLPGATGSTAGIVNEVNGYEVKRFSDGTVIGLDAGHDFVIGLALFYVNNRKEAVLFADGESISWAVAEERLHPGSMEKE